MITITDRAAEKVKELLDSQGESEDRALRVAVKGGGCSGFQYALTFDQKRDDDELIEDKDVHILVDEVSKSFTEGSEIDYVEGLQGAGFSVNNPNVVASCGCGQSFRTADEAEAAPAGEAG